MRTMCFPWGDAAVEGQMETVRQELDHEYQAQNGLAPKPSADADQTKLTSMSRT